MSANGATLDSAQAQRHWESVYARTSYGQELAGSTGIAVAGAQDFFGDLRGRRLLDLGCGKGATAVHFARQGADVVAIDMSATAIGHLRQRCATERLDNLSPLVGSATDIAGLGRFDLIFGTMILHHIEPFAPFAAMLHAALAPDGKAYFYENNAASQLLVWCRKHMVGRWSIPRLGDTDEFPLTSDEIGVLRRHFSVDQRFPDMLFFRMAGVYLLRGRLEVPLKQLDKLCGRLGFLQKYSYRQELRLTPYHALADGADELLQPGAPQPVFTGGVANVVTLGADSGR